MKFDYFFDTPCSCQTDITKLNTMYCQSGVVETSMPVTSVVRVRFPVEAGLYVIEWAPLFDSGVGLLRGLRFPPTYQNRPVLFDEQL